MTILQTKRSAKPKLAKEEKVFSQYCRERRSYSANQDLDTIVCPICGSVKVTKNGTRSGRQRYLCKECKKTFGDTNGTVAFRSKLPIGQWIDFIKLTLQGESCRTIAKNLGINKQTALHNRYRICSVLLQFVSNQDGFKSLEESDGYYYPFTSCRLFMSAEYSQLISNRHLFPISPKILFWLQTATEYIRQ